MGLVRKILLLAVADGLVLLPLSSTQRSPTVARPATVEYNSCIIRHSRTISYDEEAREGGLEVYGVVGLLRVANEGYLIAISRRTLVARIWGKPVYVITGVVLVPLKSQKHAQGALDKARLEGMSKQKHSDTVEEDDSEEEVYDSLDEHDGGEMGKTISSPGSSRDKREPGIAQEVLGMNGLYGRFTNRWFSRRGWVVGQRFASGNKEDESTATNLSNKEAVHDSDDSYQRWPQTPGVEKTLEDVIPTNTASITSSLLPKLVQTTNLLLTSRTFYFSYDIDITRRLMTQRQTASNLPLHSEVDPEYFWNNHLLRPFIENGCSHLSLPLMQGFVGQREFTVEGGRTVETPIDSADKLENDLESTTSPPVDAPDPAEQAIFSTNSFLLTVVSRRSTKRSGLRYLRRGIDESGDVANAVETEQILSRPSWAASSSKIYSFVQTRGSIPLFFSQMPYAFKPLPVLHASADTNQAAMRKHFDHLSTKYGSVQAISLVDKHEPEVMIGEAYESAMKSLNAATGDSGKVEFEWFAFHSVCHGMKFENVSILVDSMLPFLSKIGHTTLSATKLLSTQTGIMRSNCMDCLDRTNVVQSAFAQHILAQQLADLGFTINFSTDPSTMWFNALWADNGDAVSRAYTGTSALKGDYTRTRKRNTLGALTDLTLTLSRYYHNLFDDFFAQAAIDFLLGVKGEGVFNEFEATMTTADPGIDLERARASAVASAANVVVEPAEDFKNGWCFSVPAVAGTRRTFPFADALLLLTDHALYFVSFDWVERKVRSFERISLERVEGLQRGTYITETHAPAQTDPVKNVGFLLRLRASSTEEKAALIRVNTRSLENARVALGRGLEYGHDFETDAEEKTVQGENGSTGPTKVPADSRILVFKALQPPTSAVSGSTSRRQASERDVVKNACDEIKKAVDAVRKSAASSSAAAAIEASKGTESGGVVIEEEEVLSLEQAKKSTGIVESLAFSIKRALWG